MTDGMFIVPGAEGDTYIPLARSRQGRLVRKQILRKGEFHHQAMPGGVVTVDDTLLNALVKNFNEGVCPIVQFPVATASNQHTEEPEKNAGEVIALELTEAGLDAVIDVRKPEIAEQVGKTILGASAMFAMNYEDTRSGEKVGPTLMHVCATNRPHLVDLEDYKEVVAATATDNSSEAAILLSVPQTEDSAMTRDELITALKEEHGVDVVALQAAADAAEKVTAALSAASGSQVLTLSSGSTLASDDIVTAVSQLAQETLSLSATITEMKNASAVAEVDAMVEAGRIEPANRDAAVELRLSAPAMFETFIAKAPVIAATAQGTTAEVAAPTLDLDAFATSLVAELTK